MATDPRPARSQSAYSNAPAKLPALPTIRVTDPQMQRFIEALRVWIDARSGARDIFEKAVTMRDLVQLGLIDGSMLSRGWGVGAAPGPNVVVETPTTTLTMSNEAFANSIINTRLFQELMRRLDDPARFDALPEEIRSRLLVDIAAEAEKRGADIRRIEEKIQTQEKSMAVAIDEVTAAVDNSVAGVRQSVFAYADENRAVAGSVTQIKARIDGVPIPVDQIDTTVYASLAALQTAKPVGVRGTYYQVDDPASTDNILYQWNGTAYYIAGRGTTASAAATIEEQMTAIADRAQGLEAQYTLKLQAGNKVAGFGLAATDNTTDGATSAFIVSADKFAIVDAADNIPDPLSPPLKRVPFGVDTVNDVIYINGQVRINAGGTALSDIVTQSYALRIDLSNEQFQVATDKDGNNGVFGAQAESSLAVYRGSNLETIYWTFSATTTNCTAQLWSGSTWVDPPTQVAGVAIPKVRVTSMSADNCVVTITATRTGSPNLTTEFTGSKVKAGVDGTPATIRFVSSTAGAIKRTEAGDAVPASVTFNAYSQTGSGVPSAYSGRIRASYSVAATPTSFTTITPDPTVDASSRTVTVPSDAVYVRGELFAAGGFTSSLDRETIPVIADGPTGATGARGSLTGYGANYGIYVPTTAWADYKANRVINNMIIGESLTTDLTTTTHLRAGDTVTLTDAAGTNATKAVTKYWSVASGWLTTGVVIDGNLLVNGTITGDKIGANTVTAGNIDTTGLTIKDDNGVIIFSAAKNLDLNRVAGGVDFTPSVLTDFPGIPYWWAFGPAQSWIVDDGTLSETSTGVAVVGTTGPVFFFSPPISMPGVKYTRVRARVRRLAGSGWSGFVGYSTPNHAIGSGYTKVLANPGLTSTWQTLEWDMSSLTAGGTDWTTSTITQVVFLLGATASDQFEFSQVDFYAPGVDEFGWTASNASITKNYNSITLDATGSSPLLVSPAGVEAQGANNTKVRMRIKRTGGTGWLGAMYYGTGTRNTGQVRGFSGDYIQFSSQQPVLNEWRILEWDMDSAATPAGKLNDWSSNTVYQLGFALGLTSADDFEIDWIGIGRLGPLRINRTNISTYIEGAAIGYLEVGQLKTQNLEVGSVTTLSEDASVYLPLYSGAATPLVSAEEPIISFTKSNGDVIVTGHVLLYIDSTGTSASSYRVEVVTYLTRGIDSYYLNFGAVSMPRIPLVRGKYFVPIAATIRRSDFGPGSYGIKYKVTIDAFDNATGNQASIITAVNGEAVVGVVETKV